MDSARPKNSKKLLTLQEAAKKLAVSSETLLKWNELHILKPTITHEGQIGYTEEQVEHFMHLKASLPAAPADAEKDAQAAPQEADIVQTPAEKNAAASRQTASAFDGSQHSSS